MPADLHVSGHCYCGGVRFSVNIPAGQAPIFTAYCHCDSCRRAHAAPLYQVVCIEESMLTITDGEELLTDFQRPDSRINRAFCGSCGTRIVNRFPGWRPGGKIPVVFFPNLLDEATQHALPELLRPTKHNRPGESVLDAELLAQLLGH